MGHIGEEINDPNDDDKSECCFRDLSLVLVHVLIRP